MQRSIGSGLVVVLAWMAISVCVTDLMERRAAVLAIVEDVPISLVSGAISYVYEGFVESAD